MQECMLASFALCILTVVCILLFYETKKKKKNLLLVSIFPESYLPVYKQAKGTEQMAAVQEVQTEQLALPFQERRIL